MRRGDQPGPAKVKPFETGDVEDEARGTADAHDGVDGLVWGNEDHVGGANRRTTHLEQDRVRVSVVMISTMVKTRETHRNLTTHAKGSAVSYKL